MISIPFNLPCKVHVYNRRWVIRDPQNREIVELGRSSNSIDYDKKMTQISNLLQDLMNGAKSISYNPGTRGYDVMNHPAPMPGVVQAVPGTIAAVEQALMEKMFEAQNGKTVVENVQEVAKAVVEEVKRRGRPKKK